MQVFCCRCVNANPSIWTRESKRDNLLFSTKNGRTTRVHFSNGLEVAGLFTCVPRVRRPLLAAGERASFRPSGDPSPPACCACPSYSSYSSPRCPGCKHTPAGMQFRRHFWVEAFVSWKCHHQCHQRAVVRRFTEDQERSREIERGKRILPRSQPTSYQEGVCVSITKK